jgi:hypothetical protein
LSRLAESPNTRVLRSNDSEGLTALGDGCAVLRVAPARLHGAQDLQGAPPLRIFELVRDGADIGLAIELDIGDLLLGVAEDDRGYGLAQQDQRDATEILTLGVHIGGVFALALLHEFG